MITWLRELDGHLLDAFIAGVITMLATGVGALPVLAQRRPPAWAVAAGSAMAGGMMVSVTVFELLLTEVLPKSLTEAGKTRTAWAFAIGFVLLMQLQWL